MYSKIFFIILTLFFTACSFKSTVLIKTKEKYALVIGNNRYQETPLRNARIDAIKMRNFLRKKGFHVTFLQNGTTNQMRRKINSFINRLPSKSVALVYYSGHGTQEKVRRRKVQNYLIPVNNRRIITLDDLEKYAISLDEILIPLTDKNQGLNIVILDACRSSILRAFSRSSIRGFAPTRANGVFIAYATESGKTASDDGLFRKTFIKYAKQNLELEEIFDHVKEEIEKRNGQTPFVYDDKNGNFKFTDSSPASIKDTGYYLDNKDTDKYAFYGRFSYSQSRWISRYFNITNRNSYQQKPQVGDTLKALGEVNIRSGYIFKTRGNWKNLPIIGGIHRGDTIVIKEVKEVVAGFYWVRF